MFAVSGSMYVVYSDCIAIFFIGSIFKTFADMYMYVGHKELSFGFM